jgi:hypothetical protein
MAIQAAQVEEESTDLGPVASGFADKTFLGGMSLGARTWLFFLACVLAGAAFIALFIHVDERLDSALQTMQRATPKLQTAFPQTWQMCRRRSTSYLRILTRSPWRSM